ncbi:MAG: hypothetical protein A2Y67_01715 [Candidatus Buchananbacteria bacterium RBG_13_39_9]|uniref:Type II secretion system protein GspG C-terminal domain-containing protein n=1 Tax=Candidatus Buchananbacteria bacterium RBG_13_39_9 TaxID=1797531 RepID=A0A1G1XQL2_9BACT|nr:MAG: hypothetical protein A2Y67_01715 [Candidatus Buchananbacteria bacterium RBG_13_39_9]
MNNKPEQGGFSLIELLIVIVVIILLGTISVIALNNQRAKARDAQRISDIREIRTALELYRSDSGEYPIVANPIILGAKDFEKLCTKAQGGFVSDQATCEANSIYMSFIPQDPLPGGKYIYTGTAEEFDLIFTTEKASSLGLATTYHAHSQTIESPGK